MASLVGQVEDGVLLAVEVPGQTDYGWVDRAFLIRSAGVGPEREVTSLDRPDSVADSIGVAESRDRDRTEDLTRSARVSIATRPKS